MVSDPQRTGHTVDGAVPALGRYRPTPTASGLRGTVPTGPACPLPSLHLRSARPTQLRWLFRSLHHLYTPSSDLG